MTLKEKIMRGVRKVAAPVLISGLTLAGCSKKDKYPQQSWTFGELELNGYDVPLFVENHLRSKEKTILTKQKINYDFIRSKIIGGGYADILTLTNRGSQFQDNKFTVYNSVDFIYMGQDGIIDSIRLKSKSIKDAFIIRDTLFAPTVYNQEAISRQYQKLVGGIE